MAKKIRVLFAASESVPYAATGGLADVAEALPISLVKDNVIVNKVMPKYKGIEEKFDLKKKFSFVVDIDGKGEEATVYHLKEDGVNTYFIGSEKYYEREDMYGHDDCNTRYGFFAKAVIQMSMILKFKPDVVHLNDWQSAMIGLYIKEEYAHMGFWKDVKVLYTIHNLQYQGRDNRNILYKLCLSDKYYNSELLEYHGDISYMKAGIVYSDIISTVSETYAKEIQTPELGYGLDGILSKYSYKIRGIVNGIYYDKYNPKTDEAIEFNYDYKNANKIRVKQKKAMQKLAGLPEKDVPLIGVVTRLAEQKGISLIVDAIKELVNRDVQFVILGSGARHYEEELAALVEKYPDKVSANIKYDGAYARKIYASSDFFLMPSLFEPCGLSQLYSLRYGAIPIVRNTGGLSDTIVDYSTNKEEGTGFVFNNFNNEEFIEAINKALELYEDKKELAKVVKRCMRERFSWEDSAAKYIALYKEMLG